MNTYGKLFQVTLYGESHGDAIGIVVDGMIPGTLIDEKRITDDLIKRQPGTLGTTPRKEDDGFKIISGVYRGYATGAPIHVMIENKNIRSQDYEHLKNHPRPGHADFVQSIKYHGFHDERGGGRSSGRLTAALVAAGSLAKMMIPFVLSHELIQVGTLTDMTYLDDYLKTIAEEKDSVGGIVEVKATHMMVGLGDPFFQKLDAEIAKIMFSIPAVKGLEIGTGFRGVTMKGSQFNDVIIDEKGRTQTNHSGGISGGISNGNDLVIRVMIKPTSSIGQPQETYDFEKKRITTLEIGGRHDVAIIRRAGIVLENALAIVLADAYLMMKAYQ